MLDKVLIQAYRQTHYYFAEHRLTIDQVSEPAKQILAPFSPKGGLFITAWNPLGELMTGAQNQQANATLKADLLNQGFNIIDGYGESPDSSWREDSFFVYPIDEQKSYQLCKKYRQNAVVYVSNTGVPTLFFA